MDIGKEIERITVEPLKDPVPCENPVPGEDPAPAKAPEIEVKPERELVPAGNLLIPPPSTSEQVKRPRPGPVLRKQR